MCGITGIIGEENKPLVLKMASSIQHRGPNDTGTYMGKSVSLAYQRLSIIDVEPSERNPILSSADGNNHILFNGELYNYKQLRKELVERNYGFKTFTDTEVVLKAYEEYGEKCLEKLRGMFAFCIWNTKDQSAFIARDRFGIKPLYYTQVNEKFIFGSEIKAILVHPEVKRTPNLQVLPQYLSYRYVPGPETLFEGIYKLQPGHFLKFKNSQLEVKQYYDFQFAPNNSLIANEQLISSKLMELLKESTQLHLQSDVPLGVFLSGGLDSSAIVALMRNTGAENIQTFSIAFENDPKNELEKARKVAEHFNAEHHSITFNEKDLQRIPEIVWALDEPIADAVTVSKYFLSEFARKKVTVALTGEGADEVFGGYAHYKPLQQLSSNPLLKNSFSRQLLKAVIQYLPSNFLDSFFDYPLPIGEKGKQRLQYLLSSKQFSEAYHLLISLFDQKDLDELLTKNLKIHLQNGNLAKQLSQTHFKTMDLGSNTPEKLFGAVFTREMKTWLPDYILLQQDKLTMAHSLEGRVPFLDHKLVEFTLDWPVQFRTNNGVEKYLLRKTMASLLPKEVSQAKKFPFWVPLHDWMGKELKDTFTNVLSSSSLHKRSYFNSAYTQKILKNAADSKLIYGRQMWSLLNLELWHQLYIDPETFDCKYKKINLP